MIFPRVRVDAQTNIFLSATEDVLNAEQQGATRTGVTCTWKE